MENLKAAQISPLTGEETFSISNQPLDFTISNFWSWSQSNLLSNTLRGVLAEYIVKQDLGVESNGRIEWDAFDLLTSNGVKVEVKSSAYLQSWVQRGLSRICFDISLTKFWDAEKNQYIPNSWARHSDVYVFCLLHHQDKQTVDPSNLNQWIFFVLPTSVLNEKLPMQKSISLSSLLRLNPIQCNFGEIKTTVEELILNR